jgi:hypothetical protein
MADGDINFGCVVGQSPVLTLRDPNNFGPADERCSLGELTIRQDSTSKWPELSGELFTVRPIEATERK